MNGEEYDQFLEDAEAMDVEKRYNKIAEAELRRRDVRLEQLLEDAIEHLRREGVGVEQRWTWRTCLNHCIYVVQFQERQEHEDVGNIWMGLECTLDLSKEDSTWVVSEWYVVDVSMRELLERV